MPRKKRNHEWRSPLTRFLADLRERRGMTYREMAKLAGCSVSTVHGWANGAMPCETIPNLRALCERVGVSLEAALVGGGESLTLVSLKSKQRNETLEV